MYVHNLYTWADENPNATCTNSSQRKVTLYVWVDIVGDYLFSKVHLPEKFYDFIYLIFLQEGSADMLNNVPMPIRRHFRFQRDRSAARFSRQFRTHLQSIFPRRWIDRGTPIAWLPRSPDLSSTGFLLWGFLELNHLL